MGFIWGNDGPSKGCPLMGPGSSCNPWRKDGTNELLHQPVRLPTAANAGGLSPLDVERKIPRQLPATGNPKPEQKAHRGTIWGQTQSPSPTRQRHWVTFAEGRAPFPTEESLESYTRNTEAHWLPIPTWHTERAPHDKTDWSRPGEGKGEEDLECPPLLKPHLQEFLHGEELSLASAKVGDGLLPPPTSTPKDTEPSPLHQSAWIQWGAWHVEMPTWWRKLLKIPGHDDCQEFAHKEHTSSGVPKAHNQAKGVESYYTPCQQIHQ